MHFFRRHLPLVRARLRHILSVMSEGWDLVRNDLFLKSAGIIILLGLIVLVTQELSKPASSPGAPPPSPTVPLSATFPAPHASATPSASPVPSAAPMPTSSPTLHIPPETTSPSALVASTMTVIPGGDLPTFPQQEITDKLDEAGTFGVAVYDLSLGRQIYALRATQRFYAASTIKIAIAISLYRQADEGQVDLNTQISTRAEDMVPGTGRIQGDPVGTAYTLRELARRMIVDSDNVAANMLLGHLTFENINALMIQLGANDTHVDRLFFDEAAAAAGKDIRTTPGDLALLLRGLAEGTVVRPESAKEILDAMAITTDRTKIPALLPDNVSVQNKTGAIPGMEHDAAIMTLPNGHRYIAVFMSDMLSGNANGVQAIAEASLLIYNYECSLP